MVYLLGGVLLEFGEVERNQVNGQHVVRYLPAAQTVSANSGVDGKHEELVHIKIIRAAALSYCLL